MSDDLVKRANLALSDMQGRFDATKLQVFEECVDRIEELEATLKKLEYWFDTDQEILDVMGNNEKADHMRKLKMIRDALGGDSDG